MIIYTLYRFQLQQNIPYKFFFHSFVWFLSYLLSTLTLIYAAEQVTGEVSVQAEIYLALSNLSL